MVSSSQPYTTVGRRMAADPDPIGSIFFLDPAPESRKLHFEVNKILSHITKEHILI